MRATLPSILVFFAFPALAGEDAFHAGPAIADYGPVATIDQDMTIPADVEFKVRFDIKDQADAGAISRKLETAARFINMHVENGVARENIDLALVIHGGAVRDVTNAAFYKKVMDADNANAPLIAALLEHNVKLYVCGQSAAYYDVSNEDLLPGVDMALSAMTAHALLDADGYALNPF